MKNGMFGGGKIHATLAVLITLCLCLCAVFVACKLVNSVETAKLTIRLTSNPLAKNLLPAVDLTVASYDISGMGPGDARFSETGITGSSYTIEQLATGEWSIQASGKNAAGTVIVKSDAKTVTLTAGQSATLTLSCIPIVGNGTFSLNLSWPANAVTTANLVGSLTPDAGSAIALEFTINGASASCIKTDLSNGYYTLSLKLYDTANNNDLVWSWNESVLIYKDQTTTGTWNLKESDINASKEGITLTLQSDTKTQITVTLSGGEESLIAGDSMQVSATGTPPPDSWQWYLDGDPLDGETNSDLTVGSSLGVNTCHSLVAIGRKDDIAGSAGMRFKVVASHSLTEADVPDPVLREVFEEATGKSFSNITTYDLLGITSIDKTDSDLADLMGVELCSHLEKLRIPRNKVVDISMLPELKNLRTLNIKRNLVTDFSPISRISTLRNVRMSPSLLEDISWLTPTNLPNINAIGLTAHGGLGYSHALATQLAAFSLVDLELGISLNDTAFVDLYDTVLYPHRDTLQWLEYYNGGQITNAVTSRLTNLINLVSLQFSYTPNITSLDFLKTMTWLSEVIVSGDTGITDLTPLKDLYDAGGLRATEAISPAYVELWDLGMDLKSGTDNRAVVDYLLEKGVDVEYKSGNTTN